MSASDIVVADRLSALVNILAGPQSAPRSEKVGRGRSASTIALLDLVEAAIVGLIDPEALLVAEEAERSERDIARRIAATPLDRLVAVAS